ncbi:MAG: peptidoglycan recognition family protein [Bryobacteraceae bacterium]
MERPSVELVARCIGDPVIRLRFLKAVAPPAPEGGRPGPWRAFFHFLLLAIVPLTLIVAFLVVRAAARVRAPEPWKPPVELPLPVPTPSLPEVWMVEKNASEEVFSNGLHIDIRFAVTNHPRSYLAFPVNGPSQGPAVRRSVPAGIVFHTTESLQIPFEASRNGALKRIGESLLEYVGRRRAYHYLIDRFGRVFRVVAEQDAANHAGYSVWADDHWRYLNLNESFLGVSFEARTGEGHSEAHLSPAQVRSAGMLTELLRGRYRIPETNCVTHLQVSVNPDNMMVGYHTDWASGFPFEQMGLPDNYALAVPAIVAFGFGCGPAVREAATPRLLSAIEQAEAAFERRAQAAGMRLPAYRKAAQRQYQALLAYVKTAQHEARNDGDSGQYDRRAGGQ